MDLEQIQPRHRAREVIISILIVGLFIGLAGGLYIMSMTQVSNQNATPPQYIANQNTSSSENIKMPKRELVVDLVSQNDSEQSGTATFMEGADGKLTLKINIKPGASTLSQPAHIHLGACPTPAAVKYPLASVVNGKSETRLEVTFDDLKKDLPLAVNIHKSETEASLYTACGNLFSE